MKLLQTLQPSGEDNADALLTKIAVMLYEMTNEGKTIPIGLPPNAATEAKQIDANTLLSSIIGQLIVQATKQDTGNTSLASIAGMELPPYDTAGPATYYPGTNNLHTVPYFLAGNLVATVTLSYVGGGLADNDQFLTATKL